MTSQNPCHQTNLNLYRKKLKICSCKPMTGWFRDGYCTFDEGDFGQHTVCAVLTSQFLSYSSAQGNDLITPNLTLGFKGLSEGDHWCLCASRWLEAYNDGMAPKIDAEATNLSVASSIPIEILLEFKNS